MASVYVATAQAPEIQWQTFLGDNTTENNGSKPDVYPDDDGYIVSQSFDTEALVTKLDISGQIVWQQTYTVPASSPDALGFSISDIKTAVGGGYIILGSLKFPEVLNSSYVIKTDNLGNIDWEQNYSLVDGADNVLWDLLFAIIPINDGYILAGTGHDIFDGSTHPRLLKITLNGVIAWDHFYPNLGNYQFLNVIQTPDGGFAATGTYNLPSTTNFFSMVVKFDSVGTVEWDKEYGGTMSFSYCHGSSIQQTSDDGYIVAGYAYAAGGDVSYSHGAGDLWVYKLNSVGAMQWEKSFGGSSNEGAYASVSTTPEGDYVVATRTSSNDDDISYHYGNTETSDIWLIKISPIGDLIWEKTYGGSNNDGLSPNLNILNKPPSNVFEATSDGGHIMAAVTNSTDGDLEGTGVIPGTWIIKFSAETVGVEEVPYSAAMLYPNPTSGNFSIDLGAIYDKSKVVLSNILGQTVTTKNFENAIILNMDLQGVNGIYFATITNDLGNRTTFKLIKTN